MGVNYEKLLVNAVWKIRIEEYIEKIQFDDRISNELLENWYLFLRHIQNPHAVREMTLLLENQKIYNHTVRDDDGKYEKEINIIE